MSASFLPLARTRAWGWSFEERELGALNLRWWSFGSGTLADGSVSYFDVYHAKVVWDGRVRGAFVDELDATPLVGMALLRGGLYATGVPCRKPCSLATRRRASCW